jgi:enamine deaminase RidA (YjgF/YER057c/UK114 family)
VTKEYLNPPELFDSRPYGFSQVVTSGPGRLVFLSGQVAWDAAQAAPPGRDLRRQCWKAMENVDTAVRAAGGRLTDIVSLRIYIVTEALDQQAAVGEALLAFFPPDQLPATTWIAVPALSEPDFLVEIEPIAVIERPGQ